MLNNKTIKRYLIGLFCCLILCVTGNKLDTNSSIIEKAEIQLSRKCPIEIVNKEGETLIIDANGKLSGTMNILKQEHTVTMPSDYVLTVRKSDSYIIKKTSLGHSYVAINYVDLDGSAFVSLNDVANMIIDFGKRKRVDISGKPQKYSCEMCINGNDIWYSLDGWLSGKLVLEDKGDKLIASGTSGKTTVTIADMEKEIYEEDKNYYFCDGENELGIKNGKPYVNNAVKLNSKSSKELESLYVRPINNDKEMLLTWTKVKKANSYVIYKYDNAKKKFKKIAVQNGNDANYYAENIVNNEVYNYKVVAKKKKDGKGKKIGGKGYEVSAVSGTNEKANVTAVIIKGVKKVVIKKASKNKLRLKCKNPKLIINNKKIDINLITSQSSKKLLSNGVRWFSFNKKILKVNAKTGKIKILKKGKCSLWAKAHNGVNSKHIKVVVK